MGKQATSKRRKRRRRKHTPTEGFSSDAEFIDPEKAQEYLDQGVKNRRVRKKLVERFAAAMSAGHWKLTGESIKFNTKGEMVDGQHRLRAIIESGKTIEIVVDRNVPDEAFMELDTGGTRTPGDLLQVAGYDYTNGVASAIRNIISIYEIEAGSIGPVSLAKRRIPSETLLEWAEEYGEALTESVKLTMSREMRSVCGPPAMFGALRFIFTQANRKGAEEFFTMLIDGLGFEHARQDPVYQLRRHLLMMRDSKLKKRPNFYKAAITIKAWNAFQDRETITTLRYSEAEAWPEINRRRGRLAEGQAKKRRKRRAREAAREDREAQKKGKRGSKKRDRAA